MGVDSIWRSSSAVHILKELLIYELWKLRIKSSHILSVFNGIPLSASDNTAEMVVCTFGSLYTFMDFTKGIDVISVLIFKKNFSISLDVILLRLEVILSFTYAHDILNKTY